MNSKHSPVQLTIEEKMQIAQQYLVTSGRDGVSLSDLAKEYGVSRQSIFNWVNLYKVRLTEESAQ